MRWARLGVVGGDRLELRRGGVELVNLPITRLHEAWMSLETRLGQV